MVTPISILTYIFSLLQNIRVMHTSVESKHALQKVAIPNLDAMPDKSIRVN